VLTKLGIDAVDVAGDRTLAGRKSDAPKVLTPDAPVFVVRTFTDAATPIDEILRSGL